MTYNQRLEELAKLVGVWRSAKCKHPPIAKLAEHVGTHGFGWPDPRLRYGTDTCDGDNHVADCPVELARQDVIAAHNALGAPGMK